MEANIEIVNQILVRPDLHDARIFGINIDKRGDLKLSIGLQNGRLSELIFTGLFRLLVNNFREGNVILDVVVLPSDQFELKDVEIFYDSSDVDVGEALSALHRQVRLNNKFLIKISASYGCELFCICSGIKFIEDENCVHVG